MENLNPSIPWMAGTKPLSNFLLNLVFMTERMATMVMVKI